MASDASVAALAVCARCVAIADSKAVFSASACCIAAIFATASAVACCFLYSFFSVIPIVGAIHAPSTVDDVGVSGGMSNAWLVCPYPVLGGPVSVESRGSGEWDPCL